MDRTSTLRSLNRRSRSSPIRSKGLHATGEQPLSIETFLLDPLERPAPEHIRVEYLRRVREERKFETPEALKTQILRDVGRAQAYFRRVTKWVRRTLE